MNAINTNDNVILIVIVRSAESVLFPTNVSPLNYEHVVLGKPRPKVEDIKARYNLHSRTVSV